MTKKELAKYVLTHNLNEVIEICKKIINTEDNADNEIILSDSISIKDIPDISRKMLYQLQTLHYDNVTDLFDKEHIEKYGRWWFLRGVGKKSLMPIMVYLYKNNLIKDENSIDISFFELYENCIHTYLKKNLTTTPEKINFDLSDEERLMALKLENSNLPQRAKTILISNNIKTIGELLNITKNELSNFPQFGWKTFNDTIKSLKDSYGLELE